MIGSPGSAGSGTPPEVLALFEDGLARYVEGDASAAHARFERAHRRAPSDPRIMSWYGLTLVLVERNSNLGILYGDQALRLAGPDPEIYLNQARAHLALGQRERAVKAIIRGLAVDPHHEPLRAAQQAMGWRRKPVIGFLSRSNPINRWLGKIRHRWSKVMNPFPPASAATLGLVRPGEPPAR